MTRAKRLRAPSVSSIVGAVLLCSASWVSAQSPDTDRIVETSTGVLNEIMAIPARQIPGSLLNQAQGIAIIPNVVKGGFIVGARYGKGVVLIRDDRGQWSAPRFITLTGGSVGWQAGVQSTDVVLVFKTRNSVNGLLRGKVTIGADAAASAGPVGRNASAATDIQLKSEIYSYSRSRGLFLGVSLDGSGIQVDPTSDASYYNNLGGNGTPVGAPPASATRLLKAVNRYAGGAPAVAPSVAPPGLPSVVQVPQTNPHHQQREVARRELAGHAASLNKLLDNNWRGYLAFPREVYIPDHPVNVVALRNTLARFDTVVANPQYQLLAQRPEFTATATSLRRYIRILESPLPSALNLPPPPPQVNSSQSPTAPIQR